MSARSRSVEAALGGCALALPLAVSLRAIFLVAVGLVALAVVVATGRPTPRTVVACAVIGNGFVFATGARVASSALLWLDAVALLLFLTAGAWSQAGVLKAFAPAHSPVWRVRVIVGAVALAAVTAATWLTAASGLWLVLVAMVAAFAAVSLAGTRSR